MKYQNLFKLFFVVVMLTAGQFAWAKQNAVDDTAITTKIRSQILLDKSLSNFKVGVTTTNGVVKLSGTVDSDSEVNNLVQIAESVDGVQDVDASQLQAKSSDQPTADTLITAKIKGMFVQKKLFTSSDVAAMTIHVETNNGIVYLTGMADNQNQVDNAILIAKSVKGVKDVKANINVSAS